MIKEIDISNDGDGNRLFLKGTEIYLRLRSETSARLLGQVFREKRTLMLTRMPRHLLRVNQSYGFNYEMLKAAKYCKRVVLHCVEGSFDIPIEDILSKGEFLWFKDTGFERQIFLRVDIIKGYPEVHETI